MEPFLKIEGNTVLAIHGLAFEIEIPKGFRAIAPTSYQARFHDHPFRVTVSALIKEDTIIAIHAERLEDQSGTLDYSYLEETTLSGFPFYTHTKRVDLDVNAVNSAADLRYFKENSFDFAPAIYLKQFFVTSIDGNAEYVLTIGKKISTETENLESVAEEVEKLTAQIHLHYDPENSPEYEPLPIQKLRRSIHKNNEAKPTISGDPLFDDHHMWTLQRNVCPSPTRSSQ